RNGSCDLSATGNRGRLGGYHPSSHASTPAVCAGQYRMDLAGSEGSSVYEPYLVVTWSRGVLAHSAGRCLPWIQLACSRATSSADASDVSRPPAVLVGATRRLSSSIEETSCEGN